MDGFELMLFSGLSNQPLAEKIALELKTKLGDAESFKFANGEFKTLIKESVRGKDVFVIQSHCNPVHDTLMEQLIFIDALKRASAQRITAVIPFYGYARQDKKFHAREPVSAKLVADMITVAGANRVITLDLHSPNIQGFFNIPVDNLTAGIIFCEKTKHLEEKDFTIVAPDEGAMKNATVFSKKLGAPIAFINKSRETENEATVHNVVGNVKGRECVIFEDMIDTGGTICESAKALNENGAKKITVYATHGVFSGNAIEKLEKSPIDKVIITDSIPFEQKSKKIEVISVAPLIADAIKRIHEGHSVSELFK